MIFALSVKTKIIFKWFDAQDRDKSKSIQKTSWDWTQSETRLKSYSFTEIWLVTHVDPKFSQYHSTCK